MKRIFALLTLLTILTTLFALPAGADEAQPATEAPPFAVSNTDYLSFTGTVDEVRPFYNTDGTTDESIQYVLLKNEEEAQMNFVVDADTLLVNDPVLEAGQKLTGFYDGRRPAILIYPPQQPAIAIPPYAEGEQSIMAYFDENLLSTDGLLQIASNAETEITDQRGEAYEGELGGQVLLVIYGPSTRSIPAKATALRIMVLDARQQTGGFIIPEDEITVDGLTYVVEGQAIEAAAPYVNEEGTMMVPLAPIAEALGLPLTAEDGGVYRLGRDITLTVGKDYYTYARLAPISLGAMPAEKDGDIYVPLNFFTEVAHLNNAYVFEGQIVIDNGEKME